MKLQTTNNFRKSRKNIPQIIYENEKPAYAVIPWEEWQTILAALNDDEDSMDELIAARLMSRPVDPADLRPIGLVQRLEKGENPLKVYREWRNMSQRELAETAGISLSHISKIECGLKMPSRRLKIQLAEALAIDPDELDSQQEDRTAL